MDNSTQQEAVAAGAGGIANTKGANTGNNTRNVTGSGTYTDGNNTGRDEATLGMGAAAAGVAAGAGAVTTTRNSKTTTDTNVNESEEYRRTGGGGVRSLVICMLSVICAIAELCDLLHRRDRSHCLHGLHCFKSTQQNCNQHCNRLHLCFAPALSPAAGALQL